MTLQGTKAVAMSRGYYTYMEYAAWGQFWADACAVALNSVSAQNAQMVLVGPLAAGTNRATRIRHVRDELHLHQAVGNSER